jgi:hypothetical protein
MSIPAIIANGIVDITHQFSQEEIDEEVERQIMEDEEAGLLGDDDDVKDPISPHQHPTVHQDPERQIVQSQPIQTEVAPPPRAPTPEPTPEDKRRASAHKSLRDRIRAYFTCPINGPLLIKDLPDVKFDIETLKTTKMHKLDDIETRIFECFKNFFAFRPFSTAGPYMIPYIEAAAVRNKWLRAQGWKPRGWAKRLLNNPKTKHSFAQGDIEFVAAIPVTPLMGIAFTLLQSFDEASCANNDRQKQLTLWKKWIQIPRVRDNPDRQLKYILPCYRDQMLEAGQLPMEFIADLQIEEDTYQAEEQKLIEEGLDILDPDDDEEDFSNARRPAPPNSLPSINTQPGARSAAFHLGDPPPFTSNA